MSCVYVRWNNRPPNLFVAFSLKIDLFLGFITNSLKYVCCFVYYATLDDNRNVCDTHVSFRCRTDMNETEWIWCAWGLWMEKAKTMWRKCKHWKWFTERQNVWFIDLGILDVWAYRIDLSMSFALMLFSFMISLATTDQLFKLGSLLQSS